MARDPEVFRAALSILLTLTSLGHVEAQIPDTTFLTNRRADALSGLYEVEDGRIIHFLNLQDMLDGRPVLSFTEYSTGRARALYPLEDGSFEGGSQWFRREPVAFRVRFDEEGGSPGTLALEEAGVSLSAKKVPLIVEEVFIQSGPVRLGGTLILPPGPGPHPALVITHGSGPETRRTLRYQADFLAHHGVAVMAMDKRGAGESTGGGSPLSHADWAIDLEAQLDYLLTRPEIDSTRLGLFGNSESGFVVPVVAARRPEVGFLVCRVCSALPHPVPIVDTQRGFLARRGLTPVEVEKAIGLLERMMAYAIHREGYENLVAYAESGTGEVWREAVPPAHIPDPEAGYWDVYRANLVTDPRDHYLRLKIPVLAILGEEDNRVLVDKHQLAYQRLAEGGVDLTVWVIPEASHGLMLGQGNSLGYPPGLHDRIAAWVVRAAGIESG